MKLKNCILTVFILVFHISFAQDKKENKVANNEKMVKPVKTTVKTNSDNVVILEAVSQKTEDNSIAKNDWKGTKKRIARTKKKPSLYVSKVIDTVYIEIPISKKDTRLSDW